MWTSCKRTFKYGAKTAFLVGELAENTPSSEVHVLHQLNQFPLEKNILGEPVTESSFQKRPYVAYVENHFLSLF